VGAIDKAVLTIPLVELKRSKGFHNHATVMSKLAGVGHLSQHLLEDEIPGIPKGSIALGTFSEFGLAGNANAVAAMTLIHGCLPRQHEADGTFHRLFHLLVHDDD